METDPKKRHLIEYKSIVLDIVEKYKTYERVKQSMTADMGGDHYYEEKTNRKSSTIELRRHNYLNYEDIKKLPEGLLYKFRKCKNIFDRDYLIADLKSSPILKHFTFSSLYEKRPVCTYCKTMYDKIDHLRVQADNENNPYLKNIDLIPGEITKYLAERERRDYGLANTEKIVFSEQFYLDLQLFDHPVPKDHIPPPNFSLSNFKRRGTRTEGMEGANKSSVIKHSESVGNYRKKIIDEVSLKLHLGAKEKVAGHEWGAITASTSLKLANLQSVIRSNSRK